MSMRTVMSVRTVMSLRTVMSVRTGSPLPSTSSLPSSEESPEKVSQSSTHYNSKDNTLKIDKFYPFKLFKKTCLKH